MKPFLVLLLLLSNYVASQMTISCPDHNPDLKKRCSCSGEIIECSSRALTTIPNFEVDNHYSELRLEDNLIENITRGAFTNLKTLRRLFLHNNNISRIDDDAFSGVEFTLYHLYLANNSLRSIPAAIGELDVVILLDVTMNPIGDSHFDENTMYKIGDTITHFEFGSKELKFWPRTIRHLQALEFLNVTGGSFLTLPVDAFRGFEGTLLRLSLQNTQLISLPFSIAMLRFLRELHFDHNHNVGDNGVFVPSYGGINAYSRLLYISLIDNNLTLFPPLLKVLHNVRTFVLDSNNLAFVSDESVEIAVGTKVTDLSIQNCSLSRVPGALSKLTNLTKINLSNNHLRTLENKDFDNLHRLRRLIVSKNPIINIANETFKDLTSLEELDLTETNIRHIPDAIQSLRSLYELKLPINKIECTCNIAWLKHFKDACNLYLTIDGSCETINYAVDIYLRDFVPYCPNYKNDPICS